MAIVDTLAGNGVFVMFLAVLIGMGFGQLNLGRGIRFGVAGPLFAGLILGHIGFTVPAAYSGLTLALFVAAVGLIAAQEIEGTIKTYGLNYYCPRGRDADHWGCADLCLDAIRVYWRLNAANHGLLLRRVTSSPALGAAVEALPEAAQAEYQIGHSVGYVVGVLIIVMFEQLYPVVGDLDIDAEKQRFADKVRGQADADGRTVEEVTFSVLGFALALVAGAILGTITIPMGPLGEASLGTTGGVLIAAFAFGYMGNVGPISTRMDSTILSEIRAFTLAMFLAVTGINAGGGFVATVSQYGLQVVAASAFNSIFAIIGGLVLTRFIWNMDWIHAAGGITGGHTDTKGLAAAIDATQSDEVAAGYGNTYPFALLAMVIYAKLLVAIIPL